MDQETFEAALFVSGLSSKARDQASVKKSRSTDKTIVLCSESGTVLARVSIEQVATMKQNAVTREKLREQQKAANEEAKEEAKEKRIIALRSQGSRARAYAWARSMGYVVPSNNDAWTTGDLVVALLLCMLCLLPGIIFIMLRLQSNGHAKTQGVELVNKWIEAGKPDPVS
jgi:hypothetical protein